MSGTKVILEPYEERMFEEFIEVVMQDAILHIDMDNPKHVQMMRDSLAQGQAPWQWRRQR